MMRHSAEVIGAKALYLKKLSKKFNVPKFFCISTNEIEEILADLEVTRELITRSFRGTVEDRKHLRQKIVEGKIQKEFKNLTLLSDSIIIRSAAVGEDSESHSFAGIFESVQTKNNREDFNKALLEVISEAFSERVYHYARQAGLLNFPPLSIIVQNFVNATYGGVTFSETSYNNRRGMLINAVKGSAERAVKGESVEEIFVQDTINKSQILPSKVLRDVVKICRDIQNMLGTPQDIEWCYTDQIYVLQSRPITKNVQGEVRIWDNSNIAESYSGIVLPLTCSFARFIYAQVYRDVARTSNISKKKIQENAEVFDNLLGFFYGRFYYNMLNWYKMLTLFPGYKRNKRNLDMMISAKSQADLDQQYHNNVHFRDKVGYYSNLIIRIFTFERDLKEFKAHVKNYLQRSKKQNLEKKPTKELWKLFEDYQENLLKKWSITVDNDFLAMTWFGFYKQYAEKQGATKAQIVSTITDIQSVISAEQVEHLQNISKEFRKDSTRMALAKKKQYTECYQQMMNDTKMKGLIQEYLVTYGGRFANELKLEAKDLDSDHEYIVQVLYAYTSSPSRKAQGNSEKEEYKPSPLLSYFARKSKHYLRNREELRLLRSQAFSYTRRLFLAMGKQFSEQGILDNPDDIFYLELDEIKLAIEKRHQKVKSIVNKRKKDYQSYKDMELDSVLITTGSETPTVKFKNDTTQSSELTGIGCSAGTVTAKVTLLEKFMFPDKPLEIVVTRHTDPGWTPLFGMCQGLIVENGGLLSHAAIISRELGLPCIIGVNDAMSTLKTGQKITMNGTTGEIRIEE